MNRPAPGPRTHEGAPAARISAEAELRRSVLACLLWEQTFYEDGTSIAERIATLAAKVEPEAVAALALEARHDMKLRHAPLWLCVALARRGGVGALLGDTVAAVVRRPDEAGELLHLLWGGREGKVPSQFKSGLRRAFATWDAYQLGRYAKRPSAIRLRDVLALVRPKPATPEQSELWLRLRQDRLDPPDTWEVALSAGADKRATFTRLIEEGRLGYLALLRNLRGMDDAGVDPALIDGAIRARKGAQDVLPFRFVAAARAAPRHEPALDAALAEAVAGMPALEGPTAVLVDVSGSMDAKLSRRSDLTRVDAACALASIVNAPHLRTFTFSQHLVEVPPRRGMAGVDALRHSQPHSNTQLGAAVGELVARWPAMRRLIVVTDEQSHDRVRWPAGAARTYVVNVGTHKNGVGYGPGVTHIDGWSEAVLRWIAAAEAEPA